MRNASRSIYLSFHAILSVVARAVTRLPVLPTTVATLDKRVVADDLGKGALGGYVVFIILLVILSGITAGLTLGLMSLDETQLYVLSQSGSPKQKRHAAKIIPIRKNGHLLLVSLLLMNVISNETLPIISEKVLGSGVISVVISTVMIVIFSEILPQAICSTHGLAIGAAMAVPVKFAIVAMFVVAWPVAKLLDLILGENHGMVYRRAELKELIDFHSQQAQHGGDLSMDAVTVIRGALDLQEKKVKNSMTVLDGVFMLESNSKLDRPTIQKIVESGHSRVPIFEYVDDEASVADFRAGHYSVVERRKNIIGCLLAKNLLLLDPDDEVPLSKVSINHIPSVQDDLPLFDILNIFQEGRSHLAIVVNSPATPLPTNRDRSGSRSSSETVVESTPRLWTDEEMIGLEPIGIITLEDVLEELIGEQIWDETDAAEPRPRAGIVVPLQGTGESLVLATNRGRTVARATSTIGRRPFEHVQTDVDNFKDNRASTQIEMVTLPRPTTHIDRELASYHISRSNSAAPADAKLPSSVSDPFAEEYASLVTGPSLRTKSSLTDLQPLANKHIRNIKTSRPLSSEPSRSGTNSPGTGGNRFKSRSTSSSARNGAGRRTQSAHTPSTPHEFDSQLRSGTFNDFSEAGQIQSPLARQTAIHADDEEDSPSS